MKRESERRWHHRRSSAFSARIVFNNHTPAMTCTVQNLSSGGVQLAFATIVELPPEFVLEVPNLNLRVEARVVWSRAKLHGVTFLWPQHNRRMRQSSTDDA